MIRMGYWIGCIGLCILAALVTSSLQYRTAIESKVSSWKKILAIVIDYVHVLVTYISIAYVVYIVLLVFAGRDSHTILLHTLVLDTLMLTIVGLFLVYKMCILTIWYNALLDIHPCSPFSAYPITRLRGDNMKNTWDFTCGGCPRNSEMWMSSYAWMVGLLVIVNILVLLSMYGSNP
jgi:hypothetical protein